MPFVTITEEAAARAWRDAERDQERALRNGWGGQWRPDPAFRFGSYCAEEAVAALLGVTFERDPDGFNRPDVGGWSVRFGSKRGYGLVTHGHDRESPYALVVPGLSEREFEVIGTLLWREARALRELGVGSPLPGNTDAWLIPQRHLHEWGSQ